MDKRRSKALLILSLAISIFLTTAIHGAPVSAGVSTYSTWWYNDDHAYTYLSASSTSMAILPFPQGDTRSNTMVRSFITEGSADDLGDAGWDQSFGDGRINAFQALGDSSEPIPTPTPEEPTATPTATATSEKPTATPTATATPEEPITIPTPEEPTTTLTATATATPGADWVSSADETPVDPAADWVSGTNEDAGASGPDSANWVYSEAANYYVDSVNGSDSNSGTSEVETWRTIQKAANTLQPGDTVYIRGGTYPESVRPANSGNQTDGYIAYIGYDGEVIIDGADIDYPKYGFDGRDRSYIKLENLKFVNWFRHGIYFADGNQIWVINCVAQDNGREESYDYGIALSNINTFFILGSQAINNWRHGIYVEMSEYGLISDCIASQNNGPGGYADDHDGIILQNSRHIRIDRCEASYNGEDGIDIGIWEGNTGNTEDIIVSNSVVHHNPDGGFTVSGSNDPDFETQNIRFINCLSYQNAGGFAVYEEAYDTRLVNCTIVDNNQGQWKVGVDVSRGTGELKVKNSIVAFHEDYNVYYSDETGPFEVDHNDWYTKLPEPQYRGDHYISKDPEFVNASGEDYHLMASSPCIDAGGPLAVTTASGTGKTIRVDDSGYFTDGWGIIDGDTISVGSSVATIVEIPDDETLIVDRDITWNVGDWVNLAYSGQAPDIGAYEYTVYAQRVNAGGDEYAATQGTYSWVSGTYETLTDSGAGWVSGTDETPVDPAADWVGGTSEDAGASGPDSANWVYPDTGAQEGEAETSGTGVAVAADQATWAPDQAYDGSWGYTGGTAKSTSNAVSGTTDDALYQQYREDPGEYRYTLPNGNYEVTLSFAEFEVGGATDRQMRITIEGIVVEDTLSIYALVGKDAALDRVYQVTVNDGELNVLFTENGGSEKPIVSAVAVVEVLGGGPTEPTPTPTPTATPIPPTPTPTPTPTATPIPPTPTPTSTATTSTHPCDLPGDLDCDCDVDLSDIMLVTNHWDSSVGDDNYDPAYDLDDDGDIDTVDIMLVVAHWGDTCQ